MQTELLRLSKAAGRPVEDEYRKWLVDREAGRHRLFPCRRDPEREAAHAASRAVPLGWPSMEASDAAELDRR